MTAPEERAGGFDANARGIAVLVVAVLVALLLLFKAGGDGTSTPTASDTSGGVTTTAPLGGSTTTTPDNTTTTAGSSGDRAAKDVKVLVLNGSGLVGVAKTTTSAIGAKGYSMMDPANASANAAKTAIYYEDGYQADAEAVASALGKSADIVEAMPSTPPGPGADAANVVVVLGQDTPPA